MSDDSAPRHILARAVQSTATEDNDLADHLLLGFVTIAEWLAPNGRRYLTMQGADGQADPIPEWTVQGYLANALGDMASWTTQDGDDE